MSTIDRAFIERLQGMDEKAVELIRRIAYKKIHSYTKDHEISQDLAQDSTMKVLENVGKYQVSKHDGNIEASFRAWVNRISFNTFLNYREKRKHEIAVSEISKHLGLDDELSGDKELDVDTIAQKIDERDQFFVSKPDNPLRNLGVMEVRDIFSQINDPRKRMAVELKFLDGYSIKEIADAMNENFDSIQSVIFRARKALQMYLIKKGIDVHYLDSRGWEIDPRAEATTRRTC